MNKENRSHFWLKGFRSHPPTTTPCGPKVRSGGLGMDAAAEGVDLSNLGHRAWMEAWGVDQRAQQQFFEVRI